MPGDSGDEFRSDFIPSSRRIRIRENGIIITIIFMMFLCGITTTIEDAQLRVTHIPGVLSLWSLCHTVIPVPALYLAIILSNYTGRKPVLIAQYILSLLILILHSLPRHETLLLLAFIVQGIFKGGTIAMTFIPIWEYGSLRRKFTYVLANVLVWQTGEFITRMVLCGGDMRGKDSLLMRVFPIVLGLLCLKAAWKTPESPYWLASKGRIEESRRAFVWLRGEQGEEELEAVLQAPRVSGPPQIFNLSLLITIFTVSLYKIDVWQKSYTVLYTNPISHEFKTAILLCSWVGFVCIIAAIFNNVKRKIQALAIIGLPLALYYVNDVGLLWKTIQLKEDPNLVYTFNSACNLFSKTGPLLMGLTFLSTAVAQKYRPRLYAFISTILLEMSTMLLIKLQF